MDIKDIIKNRRIELGLTLSDVAKAVGVSQPTVSRWETGDINNMKRDKISKLSDVLQLNPAVIMGWEAKKPNTIRKVKVLGTVTAGTPISMVEDVIGFEEIPSDWEGEYFVLKIRGDSMFPAINDGDRVIVKQQETANSGDVVIVTVNGEDATCKKIQINKENIMLVPINGIYDTIVLSAQEVLNSVRILGRVVEVRRKF